MPRLYDLTNTGYNDPMGAVDSNALPLPAAIPLELKRVYITGEEPKEDLPVTFSNTPVKGDSSPLSNNIDKILNSLFRPDEKRLQLWPERVLREGLTAAGKVSSGEVPQWAIDPATGDVHTSPQMVEKAQELSALAGSGGLASGNGSLNATPSLRPALRHKEKLYKGKPGQEHQDIIPDALYNDFQKKAMSGQDLAEYNFGFVNDKGHFLSREDALKYGIDNGLIDPQAGKYGALTSTLFADSSKPGTAIEAMKPAQPFFSALEHNVSQIPQAKMTGDQWLGTLGNKPGVKPEELQWTGLADFLTENKGKPVTKAQIEEHLQNNKVELKEVNKGVKDPKIQEFKNKMSAKYGSENWSNFNKLNEAEKLEFENLTSQDLNKVDPTKYHSYQLPGGENYREMLMTLPNNAPKAHLDYLDSLTAKYKVGRDKLESVVTPEEAAKVNDLNAKSIASNSQYRSSHWDEPNILAHVRMNDRTIDGKKSLHLEEIQSDWHQQGRDKGYKNNLTENETLELKKLRNKIEDGTMNGDEAVRVAELENKKSAYGGVPDAPFKKTWHELALKRMLREASEKGYDRLSWTPGEAQAARYDLSKQINTVHVTPSSEGTHVTLNAKSGVHGSATVDGSGKILKGYDSFKGGEGKSLSDFVGKELSEKILNRANNQPKRPEKLPDGYDLIKDGDKWGVTPPGQIHARSMVGMHQSKDEAIRQAINHIHSEQVQKHAIIENVDLRIGGEGMKGFYDNMIPKALEKLGKEHGVKVKKDYVATDRPGYDIISKDGRASYATYKGPPTEAQLHQIAKQEGVPFESLTTRKNKGSEAPVHYIDIPPSLRDTATQKGFPLFSKGGYMFQPVDYDPFAGKTELKT